MLNTGIMGGTFDPVHNGHLWIASHAKEEYGLSELWFMPAGEPYFKVKKGVSPAADRLRMTELAIAGLEGYCCSDYEVRKNGPTYTSETLSELRALYPERRFFFIVGADALFQIPDWHDPETIFRSAVILCAGRAGRENLDTEIDRLNRSYRKAGCDIRRIHCEELALSSTELRARIRNGEDVSAFLPASVYAFLRKKELYT